MLKIVCDTNVIVSSLLSEYGNPRRIVDAAIEKRIANHTSPEMLKELAKVLKEYLEFSDENIQSTIGVVLGYSLQTNPTERIREVMKDPKDDIVLECAVACDADFIVSGDRHLWELKEFRGIKIVKPAEFFKLI